MVLTIGSTMENPTVNGNLPVSPNGQQKPDSKAQPWKKHWPPHNEATAGDEHGTQKGVILEQDGSNGVIARLQRSLH
jgi:hypothetical protein